MRASSNRRIRTSPTRVRSAAETLAAWTALEATRFGDQYTAARPPGGGPIWQELVGKNASRSNLLLAACQSAEQNGFLDRLAVQIARLEVADGRRTDDEAATLFGAMPRRGVFHALSDRARGFASPAMFHDLLKVLDATAFVTEGDDVVGTAFLVAADMVLTSAHVVMEAIEQNGGAEAPTQLRNITLEFPAPRGATGTRPVKLDANQPIAAMSPPFGRPPGGMREELDQSAEGQLDYALLRLATRVEGVAPIELSGAARPRSKRLCFIIGFPNGGREAMFDAAPVLEIPAFGGRLWHAVNAVPGMSGSCCVGDEGPIALHEGGITIDQEGSTARNRAVILQKIKQDIDRRSSGRTTTAVSAPGFSIYSGAAVLGWRRKGRLLAEANADRWDMALREVTGHGTESLDEADGFHPWFERIGLQNWFAAATLPRPARRVAIVQGPTGSGNSFSLDLLAAYLSDPNRDLIRLTPAESGEWSWRHAARRVRELEGAPATRTAAGGLKYDEIPQILEALSDWNGVQRERSATPLFIGIDVKDNGLNDREWREFIAQASTVEWLRLLIVGPTDVGRHEIEEVIRNNVAPAPQTFAIDYVGLSELEGFYRELLRESGRTFTRHDRDYLDSIWNDPTRLRHDMPAMTTVEAVLLAMKMREALRIDATLPENGR